MISARSMMAAAVVVVLAATVYAAAKAGPKAISDDVVKKVTAAAPDKAAVQPAQPRRVIIFTMTKGFRHGSIPLAAKAVEILGSKTGAYEAVQTDDPSRLAPDRLKEFDAVVMDQCTGVPFDDPALKASLLEFVRGGKGIVGIHAATDAFYDAWPEYGEMMGGFFKGHPFRRISVKLDDPTSPLNAAFGGQGFEISDEIYTFKEPYSRDTLRVLLSIDWENANLSKGNRTDNDYALSWIREYGKGRVFYCAFGHDDAIWWNPAVLRHYLDGLQYALGDLKADATPSAKISPPLEPARGPKLAAPAPKPAKAAPTATNSAATPANPAAATSGSTATH